MAVDYRALFDLQGRGFMVAGAGQGIGEAAARALHAFGARVLCIDRDAERAEEIARAIGGVPAQADITDEGEVLRLIDLAEHELGRLDGLVDVVGGARFVTIRELEVADWDQQFTGNLRHAYLLGRHVGIRLAGSGGGSMVFISSIAAEFGSRAHPAYSAAKLALNSWVKSLSEEFGPNGVRANAVAPGPTLTARMRSAWDDDSIQEMAKPTVRGALGKPEEIACTVVFLASDAAGNITGQTILADGGVSVRDPIYGGGENPAEAKLRQAQAERKQAGLPWP